MHCHILPALDDGAADVEESLAMLKESRSQGVTLCVATPHCTVHRAEDIQDFLLKRQQSLERLRPALLREEVPEILLGAEVYLDNDISQHADVMQLCVSGTNYMLVEFPFPKPGRNASDWLYALTLLGVKPIIAHIDRYPEWEWMMDEFEGLVTAYQINSSRFLSVSGRHLLRKLLEQDELYLVSSDMHNMQTRRCNLAEAYERAKKKDAQLADRLFGGTAEKLLMDNLTFGHTNKWGEET